MTDEQTGPSDTDKWRGFGVLADEPEDAREGMQRVREQLWNDLGEDDSD